MVTIKTSKRHTYTADYCGVGYMGRLKMQIHDSRALDVVAREFSGLTTVKVTPDGGEAVTYENYTLLRRVDWVDEQSIIIMLAKEADNGNTGGT